MEFVQEGFFHGRTERDNNDFTQDTGCYGAYNFNTGALGVDSSGKGNDLTANPQVANSPCLFMGGQHAIYDISWGSSGWGVKKTDADLPAGFPLKNGDVVKQATFCAWFCTDSWSGGGGAIVSKSYNLTTFNSFTIACVGLSLRIYWGTETFIVRTIKAAHAYHIAVVIDGVNKILEVTLFENRTGNISFKKFYPAGTLPVNTREFSWAAAEGGLVWNGYLDQCIVFNRMLSYQEIKDIRDGSYAYSAYTWRKLAYNDYIVAPVLFDEHTVLTAEVYKTPKGEAITENTIMGRRATRTKVEALTPAEALAILGAQPTSDWLSNQAFS
jgi:hypothetical protein